MFKFTRSYIIILARLSGSLSITIDTLNRESIRALRILMGFHGPDQPHQRSPPPALLPGAGAPSQLSPGSSVTAGSWATTMPMTAHRSCWSEPGSTDWLPSVAPDLLPFHKLAWWSALLADPGCHLLVCVAWVSGDGAGFFTTLGSWLPVI